MMTAHQDNKRTRLGYNILKIDQSYQDQSCCYWVEESLMLLKGDVTIQTPRKKVRDFLKDPKQNGPRVPGVDKIETAEELKRYRGMASVGLESAKARFHGGGEIPELDEPRRTKLKAHDRSGGA
jgi:hypothetical protein